MNKLLIVDDNPDVLKQLKWGLSRGPYELHFARDAEEALATFRKIKLRRPPLICHGCPRQNA